MLLLRLLLLPALLASGVFPTRAQGMLLTGRVQAQGDKAAIPFVNIGIRGRNTGTAANANGEFSLLIPPNLVNDALTFSAIGYQEQAVGVAQIVSQQRHTFSLVQKATASGSDKKDCFRLVKYWLPII